MAMISKEQAVNDIKQIIKQSQVLEPANDFRTSEQKIYDFLWYKSPRTIDVRGL